MHPDLLQSSSFKTLERTLQKTLDASLVPNDQSVGEPIDSLCATKGVLQLLDSYSNVLVDLLAEKLKTRSGIRETNNADSDGDVEY